MNRPHKYKSAESTVDWTALAGIKPIYQGRGYSVFTEDEMSRIKAFYRDNQNVRQVWIARHLGCDGNVIHRVVNGLTQFHRPAANGAYKEAYAEWKAKKQSLMPNSGGKVRP